MNFIHKYVNHELIERYELDTTFSWIKKKVTFFLNT